MCTGISPGKTLSVRAVVAWAFVMSFFTLMCGLVLEGFKDVVAKELEKSERLGWSGSGGGDLQFNAVARPGAMRAQRDAVARPRGTSRPPKHDTRSHIISTC